MATTISNASDPDNILLLTDDAGVVRAGTAKEVAANYPTLAAGLRTAIIAVVDNDPDHVSATRTVSKLQRLGVFASLSAAAKTRFINRIEALRAQREAALVSVAATNPQRAEQKLAELIAAGVPITQATRDAVAAAQPVVTPTTPVPEPTDGL